MTALTRAPAVEEERSRAQVDPVVAILGLAIIGGVAVRAIPVVPADFPLNDGGLFATMIEGLARNGLLIPAFTRYNGGTIPFAYPPLALELGAVLHLLGIATTTILQWVPFIFSCLTIPAAYLALKAMIGDRMHAAVATLFFALLPRSYLWLISGGGITRSLGLLLALLALWRLAAYASGGRRWVAIQGGLLAGLAAMSHLEAAALVTTGAVVLLTRHRSRTTASWLLLAGLVATMATLPWVLPVVARHGLGPFLAAGGSRGISYPVAILQLLGLRFTGEAYFALGSALGIIGLVLACLRQLWWPLGWLLLIFAVIPGGAPTYALLPWSILISIAVVGFIGPEIQSRWRPLGIATAASILVLTSVWNAQLGQTALDALDPASRAAMDWTRGSKDPNHYLIVTGANWALDSTSEWFPYLTGHVSVATVQGKEFTDTASWASAVSLGGRVQACSTRGLDCLITLRRDVEFDAVYVPKPASGASSADCCVALRNDLRRSSDYRIIYDGPGATVATLATP